MSRIAWPAQHGRVASALLESRVLDWPSQQLRRLDNNEERPVRAVTVVKTTSSELSGAASVVGMAIRLLRRQCDDELRAGAMVTMKRSP